MLLQDVFPVDRILVDFQPRDKWSAIDTMLEHLRSTEALAAEGFDDVREAVMGRERSMSTGMERGLAIPHAAVEGLEGVVGCLGIVHSEEPLSFESIDARPTELVALLVIPRSQKLLHIRTLAEVARVLGSEPVRRALLEAPSPPEAWAALGERERSA